MSKQELIFSSGCYFYLFLSFTVLFVTPLAIAEIVLTFEDFLGQDGTEIGTFYPGIHFEALSTGKDWIVADVTTGKYNASSWPSGQQWDYGEYWMYDNVTAWTSVIGDGGKISFDCGARYVELGYCAGYALTLTAYDANDQEIASDSGPANRRFMEANGSGPGTLRVDAPFGQLISYVIIHDSGDFWVVDNIRIGAALDFFKTDDIDPEDCIVPEQEITYTVCWDNLSGHLLTDAYIIDWLPEGVTVPVVYTFDPNTWEMWSSHPGYDPETHSHIWPLDDIDPNSWGCVQLTVLVNEKAVPGGILHNVAELYGTYHDPNGLPIDGRLARATQDTNVCCWGDYPDILHVDQNATAGNNNGLDWPNAFLDLQDALDYTRSTICGQVHSIYVAQGTFRPGDNEADTFALPDGISVYGGFPTGGSPFEHRNPKRYETILSGRIDDTTRNDTVVTMGHETLLDGFTATEAGPYPFGYGIFGSGVDFTVNNCRIDNNEGYGLYAEESNILLTWCTLQNNKADGIRHIGEGFSLIVENCLIRQSGRYGMYCLNSTPIVLNSILSESDMANEGREGIRLINPSSRPIIRNNTFAHNRSAGIYFSDNGTVSDPNDKDWPDVQNCILWYNNEDRIQFAGFDKEHIYHSCIFDPNDPDGESVSFDLNYNFSTNPRLAYVDPNNVRIRFDSPCRDAGNPFLNYEDQLDMDVKARVYGMYVDVGAYEVVCEDVSNALDWNADGLVNLHEFNLFSQAWLTYDPNHPYADPNHPSYISDPNLPGFISETDKLRYNPLCDLDNDLHVGLSDLLLFWDAPWLWKACWVDSEEVQMQQMMGGGEMMLMGESESMLSSAVVTSEPVVQEKSALEQILDLATAIMFLEQLWFEEPDIQQEINADDWNRFMDAVYQSYHDLTVENIQIQ